MAAAAAAGGGGGGAAPAPAALFYGRDPPICNPHTAASFSHIHSVIARSPDRMLSIYGDVLHDQTANVNVDLGPRQTFTSIIQTTFGVDLGEIARMTTAGGNPTAYVLDRGKSHLWNQQKITLGVFNNTNLSELLEKMISMGITNINVDCAPINLFKHGLGNPAQPLNRLLYITNLFDAAPNLGAGNLFGARNLENTDPVTIELLSGFFFTFSIIAVGGAGAAAADSFTNRVLIKHGATLATAVDLIDLRCNGPYSLGAINQFLGLPPKRGVGKPRSTVVAVVGAAQHANATAADFTPLQKFLVMCVKEITDWGLAYKNSEINFLSNRTEGTCALASFDTYFLDMMGEICGYSLAVTAETTSLICYAKCLATATINPYSSIYDNILANPLFILGVYTSALASINTRIGLLSLGNMYGYLEYLDLQYYSNKIIEWSNRYREFLDLTHSLIGVGEDPVARKPDVIVSAGFMAAADTFSELTFSTGSNYISNIEAEALGRQGLYRVLWNTIRDQYSIVHDTGNINEVSEIIEKIDAFVAGTFKGYDSDLVLKSDRIDILRAVLYSYLKIISKPQDLLIRYIFNKCEERIKPIYIQACLVHYALDRAGRPDKIGIATFFTNVGTNTANSKIDTSEIRTKPNIEENPAMFPETYASAILGSVVGVAIQYIAFVDKVYKKVPAPKPKKGVKANRGPKPKTGVKANRGLAQIVIAAAISSAGRTAKAAAKREGAGGGGGGGRRSAANTIARIKAVANRKRGGYYARGGGELDYESAESEVRTADYDDYCELSAVPDIAATKINEMLDKYRRGELTGKVLRQNPDVNEFIQTTLSKNTTLVDVIGDILQLLLMLSDEADNSNFYYEYLTAVLELTKIYELYFSEGQDELDTDDLLNQVLYALFWGPYTAVVFESCVNSSDITIIVNMLDKAYELEIKEEEPTGEAAAAPVVKPPVNMQKYLRNTAYQRPAPSTDKPALPVTKTGKGYGGDPYTIFNLPKEAPLPAGAQLAFTGMPVSGGARRSRRRHHSSPRRPRRITRRKRRDSASHKRRTIRRRK